MNENPIPLVAYAFVTITSLVLAYASINTDDDKQIDIPNAVPVSNIIPTTNENNIRNEENTYTTSNISEGSQNEEKISSINTSNEVLNNESQNILENDLINREHEKKDKNIIGGKSKTKSKNKKKNKNKNKKLNKTKRRV
tara:strand:+ start:1025 stop:1444 length:420 start_codon:yes stop_codon:yes gene_type:complete